MNECSRDAHASCPYKEPFPRLSYGQVSAPATAHGLATDFECDNTTGFAGRGALLCDDGAFEARGVLLAQRFAASGYRVTHCGSCLHSLNFLNSQLAMIASKIHVLDRLERDCGQKGAIVHLCIFNPQWP